MCKIHFIISQIVAENPVSVAESSTLKSTNAPRLRVFLKRFGDADDLSRVDPNRRERGRIKEHSIFKQ